MKRYLLLLLATALLGGGRLVAAPEKGGGDSLFGGLSAGDPEARKILEGLVGDNRKLLGTLRKAAAERKPERSRMVGRWNLAISEHCEEWSRKIERAQGLSAAAMHKELGGARSEELKGASPTWPSDWKNWGDTQYRFFEDLRKSGFMEWLYDTRLRIEGLEDSLDDGPKIIKGYVESLESISEDIAASRSRLDRASSKADVQQELRKFTRIWTAVTNLERSVRAKQKQVEDFLNRSDTGVDSIAKGLEAVKKWEGACAARSRLDPMCKQATKAFVAEAMLAVDDYGKQRAEVLKVAAPLLEGKLFGKVKGFEGAGLAITAQAEKYEKLLHLKEDSFR